MPALFPHSQANATQKHERHRGETRASPPSPRPRHATAPARREAPSVKVAAPEESPGGEPSAIRDDYGRVATKLFAAPAHVSMDESLPKAFTHQAGHAAERLGFIGAVVARQVLGQPRLKRRHIRAVPAEVDGPIRQARTRIDFDGASHRAPRAVVRLDRPPGPIARGYAIFDGQRDDP